MDNTIKLWDVRNFKCLLTINDLRGTVDMPLQSASVINRIHWDTGRKRLIGCSTSLSSWSESKSKHIAGMGMAHSGSVLKTLAAPGSSQVVTADVGGSVRVWDVFSGKSLSSFSTVPAPSQPTVLNGVVSDHHMFKTASPDRNSVSKDGSVLGAGEQSAAPTLTAISLDESGTRVVTSLHGSGGVDVWDAGSGAKTGIGGVFKTVSEASGTADPDVDDVDDAGTNGGPLLVLNHHKRQAKTYTGEALLQSLVFPFLFMSSLCFLCNSCCSCGVACCGTHRQGTTCEAHEASPVRNVQLGP